MRRRPTSLIRPRVDDESGTCTVTRSDSVSNSSNPVHSGVGLPDPIRTDSSGRRSWRRTRGGRKAPIRSSTRRPIGPRPTTPTVTSPNRRPDTRCQRPACMARLDSWTPRSALRARATVISATASTGAPGVHVTAIPRRRAAIRSTPSSPVPIRAISRRSGADSITSSLHLSVPASTASNPLTISTSSLSSGLRPNGFTTRSTPASSRISSARPDFAANGIEVTSTFIDLSHCSIVKQTVASSQDSLPENTPTPLPFTGFPSRTGRSTQKGRDRDRESEVCPSPSRSGIVLGPRVRHQADPWNQRQIAHPPRHEVDCS